MVRTVPLALASLVGMNAISPRRLYENCDFDQSVPSRHGFHHFWTQYPPSLYDFSATAGRLISCTICRRHGSKSLDSIRRGFAVTGWTPAGNRSDRAIRPGCAWTLSLTFWPSTSFYKAVKGLHQAWYFPYWRSFLFTLTAATFAQLLRPTLCRHKADCEQTVLMTAPSKDFD